MGRFRLYAALCLVAACLLGACRECAAQGLGDGSPYPPPQISPTGRTIIATTQSQANTAPLPKATAAPIASTERPLPPLSPLAGSSPTLPAPDDGSRPKAMPSGLLPPLPDLSVASPPATPRPAVRQVNHTAPADSSPQAQDPPMANATPRPEETDAVAPAPSGAQTAVLKLEVVGPSSIPRDQQFAYEIVLRNNGSTPAYQVQVDETLQTGVRCLAATPQPESHGNRLLWSLGTLAAGAEQRLRVEVQPQADGEVISNARATFTTSGALHTHITQPELSITQTLPESAQVGDEIVLQLQVANKSTRPVAHVLVRDRLPPGLRHAAGGHVEADVGTLAPGETKTLTLRAQAVQAGRQVNEASVMSGDGTAVSAQAVLNVTRAALALRETGPRSGLVNEEMEYRLEVASTGTAPATNVHLSDALPTGLEFVSASEGGKYAAEARTVSWSLGTLPPGQTSLITFRVQSRQAGNFLHQPTAIADHGIAAKAEGSVRIEGVAALSLSVVDRQNLIEVNAETTYEIRVVNQGSGPAAEVRIIALTPDGLTPISAQGPTANHITGQQVLFDPVSQLDAGAEVLFRLTAKGRKAGDWRFQAQLTAAQLTQPVRQEAGTRVVDP